MPVQQTIASEVQNAIQPLLESLNISVVLYGMQYPLAYFFLPTIKDTPRPNTVHSLVSGICKASLNTFNITDLCLPV